MVMYCMDICTIRIHVPFGYVPFDQSKTVMFHEMKIPPEFNVFYVKVVSTSSPRKTDVISLKATQF